MATRLNKIAVFGLVLAALSLFLFKINFPAQAAPPLQLTPFPTPTPGPDGRILYVVQPNDTLLRISLISGVSVDQLRALNNFTGDNIQVGQQLLLGLGGPSVVTPTAGPSPTPTPLLPTATPKPGLGDICVLLFYDVNGDAIRQEEEQPILDGAISINDRSGEVSQTITAASGDVTLNTETGHRCLTALPEGDYTVSVGVPEGYNPTTVTSFSIELKAGDQTYLDFGAQENSEALAQAPTPVGTGRSPILGILGGLLLVVGTGLGIAASRLLKNR